LNNPQELLNRRLKGRAYSGPQKPTVQQQHGEISGIYFPPVRCDIDFEAVAQLKDCLAGESNVLLVGGGPSGEKWEDYCDEHTVVMCANSAIKPLAHRANYFLCTEGNGYVYDGKARPQDWYWVPGDFTRLVSYCNIKNSPRPHYPGTIAIERAWHLAGFNPREYFNPVPIPGEIFSNLATNWYELYHTYIGCDRFTKREWGLVKGPVVYPWTGQPGKNTRGMCVGTVGLNAAHLLAYMGVSGYRSVGFPFIMQHNIAHWAEREYRYEASRWVPPECFMTINGVPTIWQFALSAACWKAREADFLAAGVVHEDHSDGLLQLPGIERLMELVNQPPRNLTMEDLGHEQTVSAGEDTERDAGLAADTGRTEGKRLAADRHIPELEQSETAPKRTRGRKRAERTAVPQPDTGADVQHSVEPGD
jgi:hypothetical protein